MIYCARRENGTSSEALHAGRWQMLPFWSALSKYNDMIVMNLLLKRIFNQVVNNILESSSGGT